MRPSGNVQLVWMEKPTTLWLPITPELHPYVITCDTGIKLSKMAGNSANCPLQSSSIEKDFITMD